MSVIVKEDQELQMLEKHLVEITSVNHVFHPFISEVLLFQCCI